VGAREASALRPFEDVRAQVLEEWRYLERTKAEQRFFAALLDKYELVVDESLEPLVASLAGGAQ
jgi:5'-deoxynucleotidase YfbR-like HD superfamily hydrolase